MIDPAPNDGAALAAVAVAALAVACCAGVPLSTVADLLAVGARVGIGAAVTLVFVACVALCVENPSAAKRAGSRS